MKYSVLSLLLATLLLPFSALAEEGEWEITNDSELALRRGLQWLSENQGPEGNWKSNDLGLVSLGALAFLADGHAPGRGRYGRTVQRALNYVTTNARPSTGLLNISNGQRDMYNHGLATFVLGQMHGMTTTPDKRMNVTLDRALKLIANTQCEDGGWDYKAARQARGSDLSLAVMQAKALRSAMDGGLEVPPEVIEAAMQSVREHYSPKSGNRKAPESDQKKVPGQFTYRRDGGSATIAMAAAGVVCLQEFGQYDDWRIDKSMEVIHAAIQTLKEDEVKRGNKVARNGHMPFDAYTLYYVGQALYQVGGDYWKDDYPILRDYLIRSQILNAGNVAQHGLWHDHGARSGGRVGGQPGDLYGTSVACFILAMPNRYLPILQEGKIESLSNRFKTD